LKSSPDPVSPPSGGETRKYRLAGALAGAVNGLFGGGGGMPLLFLLTGWAGLEEKAAFATCVAVILPLCAVSAAILLLRGGFSFERALPYLAGGLAGGFLGGRLFRDVPAVWLRRVFALFVLYGAWRYLT
jgi:hypothetical protein